MLLAEVFDNPSEVTTRESRGVISSSFIINKNTGEAIAGKISYPHIHNELEKRDDFNHDDWIQYTIYAAPIVPGDGLPNSARNIMTLSRGSTYDQFNLPNGTYQFGFYSSDSRLQDVKDNITGTGNSMKIMSTVMDVFNQLLAEPHIKHLIMAADSNEPSKVRLYNRMIGKLAKKTWEYDGFTYWVI